MSARLSRVLLFAVLSAILVLAIQLPSPVVAQGPINGPPSWMTIQLGADPSQLAQIPVTCNDTGVMNINGFAVYALSHDQLAPLRLARDLGYSDDPTDPQILQNLPDAVKTALDGSMPWDLLLSNGIDALLSQDLSDCGVFVNAISLAYPQCSLGPAYCNASPSPSPAVDQEPAQAQPVVACVAPPELFDPPTGRTFWAKNTILRWRGYALQPGETFDVFVWAEDGAPQILTAGIDYNPKNGEYSMQINDLYAWLPSKYTWAVRVKGPDGSYRSCQTNTNWFTLLPPGQTIPSPDVPPAPPSNWSCGG